MPVSAASRHAAIKASGTVPYLSEFTSYLLSFLPQSSVDLVLQSISHHRPSSFRVNPVKTSSGPIELGTIYDVAASAASAAARSAHGSAWPPALNHGDAEEPLAQVAAAAAATTEGAGLTRLWQCSWFPRAYLLPDIPIPAPKIKHLPAASEGRVYFQTLSSMLPALLLRARPSMKVLDLCAAPGGKATLLASDPSAMAGQGHLLAVEPNHPRMQRMLHNARLLRETSPVTSQSENGTSRASLGARALHRQQTGLGRRETGSAQDRQAVAGLPVLEHVGNMVLVQADGRYLQVDRQGMPLAQHEDRTVPTGPLGTLSAAAGSGGPFDRVLLDVPCSGSGRASFVEGVSPLGGWRPGEGERRALQQKQLLWSAARLLAPGGSLVYSSCSLGPEEGEEVVQWLLDHMHGIALADLILPLDPECHPDVSSTAGSTGALPAFATAPRVVAPRSATLIEALTCVQPRRVDCTLLGAAAGVRLGSETQVSHTLMGGTGVHDLHGGHQAGGTKVVVETAPPAPAWSVMPGLRQYRERVYCRDMEKAVRLLPCWHHEGFFIARLVRRK